MGVKPIDTAVIQHQNPIGALYAGDSLGNDDLRGTGDFLCKGLSNLRVCCRVHRRGRVVQNQNLRFLQQGPCNAQTLLLTARNIVAATLNAGLVPIGHPVNELIGTGCLAGLDALCLRGIGIAPAKVIQNGPREKGVLLKHHRHLFPKGLHIVRADIHAAHTDRALVHIV